MKERFGLLTVEACGDYGATKVGFIHCSNDTNQIRRKLQDFHKEYIRKDQAWDHEITSFGWQELHRPEDKFLVIYEGNGEYDWTNWYFNGLRLDLRPIPGTWDAPNVVWAVMSWVPRIEDLIQVIPYVKVPVLELNDWQLLECDAI